jgi:hypothetical protein
MPFSVYPGTPQTALHLLAARNDKEAVLRTSQHMKHERAESACYTFGQPQWSLHLSAQVRVPD